MLICGMQKQQRRQQTNKKTIQDYLGGSSVQKSTCSHQLGSSLQLGLCTAGEFVWNEGGTVPATCYLLPAPYITMCDFCNTNCYITYNIQN